MTKPLFSKEIDINNINISDINFNDNRSFCYISHGESNGSIYLQTPVVRYIDPIVQQQNNHNALYLFLTPHDSSTKDFIKLINNIEAKCIKHINASNKKISLNTVIKTYDFETTEHNKQVFMYLKVILLDQTKIEYQDERISLEQLNELVKKVNLKLIFEINMLWISQTKIGIYLKPLRIKAVDIVNEPIIDFREDDSSPCPNDMLHTEVDHIKKIFNNNESVMTLNDSAFNTNISKQKVKKNVETSEIYIGNFIKSSGDDSSYQHKLQNELQNELFNINNPKISSSKHSSSKHSSLNIRSDKSDNAVLYRSLTRIGSKDTKDTKDTKETKEHNVEGQSSDEIQQNYHKQSSNSDTSNSPESSSSSIQSPQLSHRNKSQEHTVDNSSTDKQSKIIENNSTEKKRRGRPRKQDINVTVNKSDNKFQQINKLNKELVLSDSLSSDINS